MVHNEIEYYVGVLIDFEDFWVKELGQEIPHNPNLMVDLFYEYPNYEGYSDLMNKKMFEESIAAIESSYSIFWIHPTDTDFMDLDHCMLIGQKVDSYPRVTDLMNMVMEGKLPRDSRVYAFQKV